jgi:inner membrane protein
MIAPTHVTFSQTFYLASCIFWASPATGLGLFVSALASFIPDFDTPTSLPGRLVPPLSEWIHEHFGHRGITHAFIPQLFVWLILWICVSYRFVSVDVTIAIAAGWFSHSCADMLTKTGVFFWWPYRRKRCVAWKNPNYRVLVGSLGEWWWSMAMVMIAIPLFMFAQTGQGTSGIIRQALGDISLAVQEYQKNKGTDAWYLQIEGTDNKTLERIDGRYYIVDVKSESAFFVENSQGKTVTVSGTASENWFVSDAVLEKGEPERTHTIELTREEVEYTTFIEALELVINSRRAFISGKFATEDKRGNIEARTLEHSTLSELPKAERRYHAINLRIQIKHTPGVEIPKLKIKDVQPKQIESNDLLDKWMDEALK